MFGNISRERAGCFGILDTSDVSTSSNVALFIAVSLTAFQRREDVVGGISNPGRDCHVLLNERRDLAPQHAGVPGQDVGVPHLDLVFLPHHWKTINPRVNVSASSRNNSEFSEEKEAAYDGDES